MSIIKMKKMRLMAMMEDRDGLLRDLMRLGCTEISGIEDKRDDPEWCAFINNNETRLHDIRHAAATVKLAIDALDRYAPEKRGIFYARPFVKSGELFEKNSAQRAFESAQKINDITKRIAHLHGEENRLINKLESLKPWSELDLPLDTVSTKELIIRFGVMPAGHIEFDQLKTDIQAAAPASELYHGHSDSEQHYLLFVCHVSQEEAAYSALKTAGFSSVQFKGITGTATQNINEIVLRIEEIKREYEILKENIAEFRSSRGEIEKCADQIAQQVSSELVGEKLFVTGKTFYFEGWLMEPAMVKFEKTMEKYGCIYELSEPSPHDDVPIKLQNTKLVEPFNMVTNMYQLPKYDGIDPNPLIAPFFAAFFGIMYADVAYGLILLGLSLFIRSKVQLRGTLKYMFELMSICAVTTIFFGFVFGGFFGDAVNVIAENLFGVSNVVFPPALLWNPLENPMETLVFALAVGGVHIITGMSIKAYMCIRDGKPLDALFDVGSWWIVFAGIALLYFKGIPWILIAGVLMLLLTQGRASKSIGGKILGGVGSLYNISTYLSDILSYSRLMALMLASSVIANVVNILGSMTGTIHIIGPILFVAIFIFGHLFNMGINMIGTYVHTARLQYLEYFNKFYKGGGTPFSPLKINTKYVDVLEEGN